ncbi:MAG TPA: hypothetical protein VFA46_07990 [Actinomycetes bacterium]|jgi:hypothetical protein|nr:hypothetical protein [Actinomycetes bacterium]
MDETKRAWDEVGEGFTELARIIWDRYRNLGEERFTAAAERRRGS